MHPILGKRDRLLLYLAAWIPVMALLTGILADGSSEHLTDSLLVAVPLCLAAAFICLGAWYPCQANPLKSGRILRILSTHAAGALVSAALLVGFGEAWSAFLEFAGAPEAADLYSEAIGLIFVSGALLFILVVAVNYLILAYESERAAETRALELRVLAREAELRALRAQIDPHFLFNSLNSIGALTIGDPVRARQMSVLLADFFRRSLTFGSQDWIPLSDEIQLADQFLSVEKVRFGSRLAVERQIDPACSRCLVPPLLLQPLVENAVKHGISTSLDGGAIRLVTRRSGDSMLIAVENAVDDEVPARPGAGLGLRNVRERLQTIFGSDARVDVRQQGNLYRVEIMMPCRLSQEKSAAMTA